MPVQLTQEEIDVLKKIQEGKFNEGKDIKSDFTTLLGMANKLKQEANDDSFITALDDLEKTFAKVEEKNRFLSIERVPNLTFDATQFISSLKPDKELTPEEKIPLLTLLSKAMQLGNDQLVTRLEQKATSSVIEAAEKATNYQPEPTHAISRGMNVNYTFDPHNMITKSAQLNFANTKFNFSNINGQSITDNNQTKEVEGSIKKVLQKVFEDYLTEKGQLDNINGLSDEKLNDLRQDFYKNYHTIDKLNAAAQALKGDKKIDHVLQFVNPTPAPSNLAKEEEEEVVQVAAPLINKL